MDSNSADCQDEDKQVTNGNIAPLPQRVLRLNRRGFFISSRQHNGQKGVKRPASDSADTTKEEERIKSPSTPAKKILKLSNSSPLKWNSTSVTSSQAELELCPHFPQHSKPSMILRLISSAWCWIFSMFSFMKILLHVKGRNTSKEKA